MPALGSAAAVMEGGETQEAAAAYAHADAQISVGDAAAAGGAPAQLSASPTPYPQYDYSAQQWQAHDPAWQQYYQQQHQQQQQQHQQQYSAPAQQPQCQPSPAAPESMPPAQQAQPPQQQPSATPLHDGTPPHDGMANGVGPSPQQPPPPDTAWQQLQAPPQWPQAEQAAADVQQQGNAPLPPLPDDSAPPIPRPDAAPLAHPAPPPSAVQQHQQQQQPHSQWPQQQWQQQWPTDFQQQQQYWQQQGYAQPAWDGSYAAANGAYQYPQYQQQWPQQQHYQHPAGYAHLYPQPQQPQQHAAYAAWPASSMPYPAHQAPQQAQVPYSAPAPWQPAAHAAAGYTAPGSSAVPGNPQHQAPPQQQPQQPQGLPVATAADLFQSPGRDKRPARIVVLLRGPPGSGKSAAARKIRTIEQDAGTTVRVHSIDDYFVTEVEKEVDDEKRAGRKRKVTDMEYLYEVELEDAYEASLLKAYTRTVDEGRFKCVLVDAPLLKAAQLREYWRLGQKAGYEVYMSLPLETDPEVCYKRNVHNRSLNDIQKAAAALEPPQPSFLQVDLSGLFGSSPAARQSARPSPPPAAHPAADSMQQQQPPAASIDEVDMDAGSDEERTPASKEAGSRKRDGSGVGGASSDDDDVEAAALLGGSRWSGVEDVEDDEITPHKKKQRKQDAAAAVAAEEDDEAFKTPAPTKRSGASLRGILSTGGGTGSAQRVRWADEGADEEAGFLVGGASREQLETVFVLEGLGPPMDDEQRQALSQSNFEDQVKGEHHSEQQLFRDHMLGGRRSASA